MKEHNIMNENAEKLNTFSAGIKETKAPQQYYENPVPGQFPIIANRIFTDTSKPSQTIVDSLAECGFNLAIATVPTEVLAKTLNMFRETGVKVIPFNSTYFSGLASSTKLEASAKGDEESASIMSGATQDDSSNTDWKEFVSNVLSYDVVAGLGMLQNPTTSKIEERADRINAIYANSGSPLLYTEISPLLSFVNKLQNTSDGTTTVDKFSTYGEYLEFVQQKIAPPIWSYCLNFVSYKNGSSALSVDYGMFFTKLEQFNLAAQATGQVMWTSCRCIKTSSVLSDMPAPTLASMRFEVFSALAYGSQGIVFNTYSNPPVSMGNQYSHSPINANGQKSDTWYLVQQVISEIKRYTEVFLGGIPLMIRHTGTTTYPGTNALIGEIGPCLSISSGNAGVLVSHFANQEQDYLIVVNHDIEKQQQVTLKFASNRFVEELTVLNLDSASNTVVNSDGSRSVSRTMEPGGYLIFKWC